MVADRSGNIYYVARYGIDKMNFSGTVTPFPLNFSNGVPWFYSNNSPSLAIGNDGNIWYSTWAEHAGTFYYGLAAKTPKGKNVALGHEWTDPLSSGATFGVVTAGFGSDIWEVDSYIHHFDYVKNTVSTLSLTSAYLGTGITKGHDGNIWYTTPANVVRINPDTEATYVLPVPYGNYSGIAAGPNGDMFTISPDCKVYELSTGGSVVNHVSLGESNCASQILVAEDALWFVANDQTTACGPETTYVIEWQVEASGKPITVTPVPNTVWGKPACLPYPTTAEGGAVAGDGNLYFAMQNGTIGVRILNSITVDPGVSLYTFKAPDQYLTLTVGETNYAGPWTASASQPAVVRIVKWVSRTQLQIESVGKGNGRIIVRDDKGNYYNFFAFVQ